MTVERISLVCLALIALVMGANYVSSATRFYDANLAYDSLALSFESFAYTEPESPVEVTLSVTNPAETAVDVHGVRVTLRAELQNVGGGEIFVDETLDPGASGTYRIDANISDTNMVRRIDDGGEINWLISGEIQVQLDEDIRPVWIDFSVRTVTQ